MPKNELALSKSEANFYQKQRSAHHCEKNVAYSGRGQKYTRQLCAWSENIV